MTQPLTEDERRTLRSGAYGAIFLVCNADPGIFDMVRESLAASKVLARSSGVVKQALITGGLPELPASLPQLEAKVLPALREAMAILKARAPGDADGYRATVLEACDRAAMAVHGIQDTESAELSKIRLALSTGDTTRP